ncbi:type I phosphomannose isomerase catalytic subunit [Coraliomargarita algicola]|uniref:Type I phosphomannose isomerase catalytic subunit n=1 Tax=Coraliomargarita algicola TaxID=3092156 RepID=A0ABZ0RG33_9BACT|nr:type I phosphomannose isomerase catalytic subunit [Coraliomargarita sp. J2-16]WPJ94179.1 type I phosphomannose isomerase catalytic subunit [Coraliomargarita sp. J2-16]
MELLTFTPLYMERVWGGRGLEAKLGRTLPKNKVIGESWELVDRKGEQSVVASGPLAGKTIRELLESAAADILGPGRDGSQPFPILIKWLDCQDRLSLQVHPPAEIAPSLGGEPKTENWYIAECDEGASLIVGLKAGVTKEQFTQALADNKAEDCVHRFPVKAGDSILVESGRMHAIDAGNLILEIQQNSDTTYRVYDWGRVGLDGAPRQLHIEESLKSIDFTDYEPETLKIVPGTQTLADCKEFRIRKFELQAGDAVLELPAGEGPRLIHVVTGQLTDQQSGTILSKGSNYLQPYVTGVSLSADGPTTLLVTDQF